MVQSLGQAVLCVHGDGANRDTYRTRRCFERATLRTTDTIIPQDRDAVHSREHLAEQLNMLACKLWEIEKDSRDVAARMIGVRDRVDKMSLERYASSGPLPGTSRGRGSSVTCRER